MRLASPIQRQLLLASKLRPDDPSPNWALLSRLPESTDAQRFAAAVEAILHCQKAFNETFTLSESGEVIVTASDSRHPVQVVAYPDLDSVRATAAALGDTVFDLEVTPAFHAEVATVGDECFLVFIGAHILCDGFGFFNLVSDFAARYEDSSYSSPDTTSPADIDDPDLRSREDAAAHFFDLFEDLDALQIDGWMHRDALGRIPGTITRSPMPEDMYQAAGRMARALGVRRYSLLVTALGVTVGALAGVSTVVVSTPMSNRRSGPNAASTRGVRVNALPIRFDLDPDVTFADLCLRNQEQIEQLIEFEQHAFSSFSRKLFGTGQMDSTVPSVSFTLYPQPLVAVAAGRRGEPVHLERRYVQYPLTVAVEVGAEVTLIVEQADHLPFADPTRTYSHVLRQALTDNGSTRLSDFGWVADGDGGSNVPPLGDLPVHTMVEKFARSVRENADGVAVIDDSRTLTFSELDALSDTAAAWLTDNVTVGTVGLVMAASVDWLATVIGLFKARKIYVPLDPDVAASRLPHVTTQLPDLVVVGPRSAIATITGVATVELPDRLVPAPFTGPPPYSEDTAYIIFTSGTTGTAKAVRIAHRSAARFFDGLSANTGFGPSRWLLAHSVAFDVSIVESFGALTDGGAVCIPKHSVARDPGGIARFVERHEVAVISATPSAFAMLSRHLADVGSVSHVLLCGERLEFLEVADFAETRPDVTLTNCYGITETTMYHTMFRLPADPKRFPTASVVGRPFADVGMAVVDDRMRVLPVGASGQIVVTGAGLMQGYVGAGSDEANRFVDVDGCRAYVTGDRGYLDGAGNFVVIGRSDNQVKIRGHRCELGEVENAVIRSGLAKRVTAMVFGSGLETELVCFVVPIADATEGDIRAGVKGLLPPYSEPDRVMTFDELPSNTNGKVDRDALARRFAESRARALTEQPPAQSVAETDVLEIVMAVWREVLGTDQIVGTTSFFDAGGTSAMVLRMGSRLRARLELDELSVVDLFEHYTPQKLSEFLTTKGEFG